ncbi:MAG: hypothetical protein HQL06_08545 [Nitrospirae bacterium]|nr:hypothetical protein [Nitrospirota bacterium]
MSVEDKHKEIEGFLSEKQLALLSAKLVVVIQNRCIETWFLGNRKICPRNPKEDTFRGYLRHYDVSIDDPELMPKPKLKLNNVRFETHAQFHCAYLKAMLREKDIRYSKETPFEVTANHYIERLIERNSEYHLKTLKCFFDFCKTIKGSIQS